MNVLSPTHPPTLGEREAAICFRECFIDDMARAAWRDPVQYRREMLAGSPRQRAVLDEAARAAGWGRLLPEGHARGIALCAGRGVVAAYVAEMSFDDEGAPRVHRVVVVMDCGDAEPSAAQARWASAGLAPAMVNALAALNARLRLEEESS